MDNGDYERTAARLGKEYQTDYRVGGVLQQQVVQTWENEATGDCGASGYTCLTRKENRTYNASGTTYESQVTDYEHKASNQNEMQFGNVTKITDFRDGGATVERKTERWFYPLNSLGTSRYIVNRPVAEKLTDGAGGCQGQTRYNYDQAGGFNAYRQAPIDRGLLYETWLAEVCDSVSAADWIRSAYYTYDGQGNRTGELAPNGTQTTTGYDAVFHAYPVSESVQPAAGLGATLTTTALYYGVNAEAGGQGLTGELQAEIDPNGSTTRYVYDSYGRLTELRQPGLGWSDPAGEMFEYTDAAPFRIRYAVRDDANPAAGPATYREDWSFYDGGGRTVQTQAEGSNSSQTVIVASEYNALDLVTRASVPYTDSQAPGAYRSAPNLSIAR